MAHLRMPASPDDLDPVLAITAPSILPVLPPLRQGGSRVCQSSLDALSPQSCMGCSLGLSGCHFVSACTWSGCRCRCRWLESGVVRRCLDGRVALMLPESGPGSIEHDSHRTLRNKAATCGAPERPGTGLEPTCCSLSTPSPARGQREARRCAAAPACSDSGTPFPGALSLAASPHDSSVYAPPHWLPESTTTWGAIASRVASLGTTTKPPETAARGAHLRPMPLG